jgi:hypothetical protein
MNQKSSLREDPQFVSWVLTGNSARRFRCTSDQGAGGPTNHAGISGDDEVDSERLVSEQAYLLKQIGERGVRPGRAVPSIPSAPASDTAAANSGGAAAPMPAC